MLSIKEAHLPFPFIRVPKMFVHLTRKRVLTMEWIAGESPTDLLSVSNGNSVDRGSPYSGRQKFDAKRRLLDLVRNNDKHTYTPYLLSLNSSVSCAPGVKPVFDNYHCSWSLNEIW